MNFTVFHQRTKDLTGSERKLVFDLLPQALQDEAWAVHAEWVGQRNLESEWLSSGVPYGFVEWRDGIDR